MVTYLRAPRSGQQHESHSQNQSACRFLIQRKHPHTTLILSQHSPANCNHPSFSNIQLLLITKTSDSTSMNACFFIKKNVLTIEVVNKRTCHMPLHGLLCCETLSQLYLWRTSFTFFMIGTYIGVHHIGLHFLRSCTPDQRKSMQLSALNQKGGWIDLSY